ncbi:retrotransposon protein, putative, ty1-copia subclass [Tanacetum coccineum]
MRSNTLHLVWYILELKRNLISLGTLEKEGFIVKLHSGKVKVINGSRVVLYGIQRDNYVYSLDGHAMAGELNANVEEKDSLTHTTQGVIDYVHSDLWGPSQVESLGGKRYFLSIVDDYSKRTGRTVKKLRTDNGLEFCNQEFQQLCIESGIARHLRVVGMPQQNSESVMYKDTLKDSGAGADKSVEELQVEVELQRLNNHTLKEDQTDQEDGDDEDAGDQETDQTLDLTYYQLARDREPRTRTKPLRFRDESNMAAYAFVAAEEEDTHEPLTYQKAVAYHPAGQRLVNCKWLFNIKEGVEGVQKPRYKARLVAHGFTHRAGIDYNEVFSLVVRRTSIRFILALIACKDYELEQLDVMMAFLHGNLEEVIYMSHPPGYEQDDMLIACKSKAGIGSTKSLLKKEFDVKELKQVKKILDRGNHVDLIGFVDLNYAKDPDKEAKYMALTEVVKEAIWLRGLLEELGVELNTVAVNYEGIMFFMKGLSTSICLDECGTWTQVTTLLGVAEYAGNPLHLQTNDNNSGSLINIKLTGSKNYKVWDTAMSIALQARNKMVFVDGLCVKSAYAPSIPLTNQWEDAEFGKHNQLMKLIQLLMGLDEVYQPIRSSLLTQIELPDVKDAFVIVCREEPHRSFGSVSGVQKPQSDMFEYGKQNTSSPYDDGEGPSDDAGEVPTYDSSNRTELDSPDVVNTRRSSKVSKLPDKLNDYVLDDKVKPDISYVVHCLSQQMHSPLQSHFEVVQIAANPIMHEKTKHFDIDVRLIREKIAYGLIKIVKVDSEDQIANILTKGLRKEFDVEAALEEEMMNLFRRFANIIGLRMPEITRLDSQLDNPLVDRDRYISERLTRSDMRNVNNMMVAWNELIRNMAEKEEFIRD